MRLPARLFPLRTTIHNCMHRNSSYSVQHTWGSVQRCTIKHLVQQARRLDCIVRQAMSDIFSYFDPSSIDPGDEMQWQHIFEEQNQSITTSPANRITIGDNGREQPETATKGEDNRVTEAQSGQFFDENLLDPALWLHGSDVPWPSIEQYEPLQHGTDLMIEKSAQHADKRPDDDMWQNHNALRQWEDWNTAFAGDRVQPPLAEQAASDTYGRHERAHVAGTIESPSWGQDRNEQQSQQIGPSRLYHHDVQNLIFDEYDRLSLNFAHSGPAEALGNQGMSLLGNAQHGMPTRPYPQGHHFHDITLTNPDQSFSPEMRSNEFDPQYNTSDQAFSPDIFSDTPGPSEFSPEPDSISKVRNGRSRAAPRNKAPNPNTVVMKASLPCVAPGCGRPFRNRTHVLDLCNRCARKHDRRTAEAQPNNLDPEVPDLQAARRLIYPAQVGRGPPIGQEELQDILEREDEFIQRFLDAVNAVVPGGEGGNVHQAGLTWEMRQQITLNQKLRMEGSRKGEEGAYRRPLITARLRALFLETYQFHTGTQECFYSIGGNNAGYNPDTSLDFQERFELICDLLRKNKRMVMDVIEGRGVKSVVANPKGYNKRKVSNNLCNEDKKEIMGKGKDRIESEEPVKKKRRRGGGKLGTVVEEGDEEVVEDDEHREAAAVAGPSKRPKRATGRSTAAAAAAAARKDAQQQVEREDPAEAELREALRSDGKEQNEFDFSIDFPGLDFGADAFI